MNFNYILIFFNKKVEITKNRKFKTIQFQHDFLILVQNR
jgi:hypothetical protein